MVLEFTVFGVALPKGNMRPLMVRSKQTGMQIPILTESNRNVKSWQQLLAHGADEALGKLPPDQRAIFDGPVRVDVSFWLPRPKSLSKRGVAVAHTKAPDLDKLCRALDALTGVVWRDDSQVVALCAVKAYTAVDDPPRATIRVSECLGTPPPAREMAPPSLFDEPAARVPAAPLEIVEPGGGHA